MEEQLAALIQALGVGTFEEALQKASTVELAGEQGDDLPVDTTQEMKPESEKTNEGTTGLAEPEDEDEEKKKSPAFMAALAIENRKLRKDLRLAKATTGGSGREVERVNIQLAKAQEQIQELQADNAGVKIIALIDQGRKDTKLSAEMIEGYNSDSPAEAFAWFQKHKLFKGDVSALTYFLGAAQPTIKLGSPGKITSRPGEESEDDAPSVKLSKRAIVIKAEKNIGMKQALRQARAENPDLVELAARE